MLRGRISTVGKAFLGALLGALLCTAALSRSARAEEDAAGAVPEVLFPRVTLGSYLQGRYDSPYGEAGTRWTGQEYRGWLAELSLGLYNMMGEPVSGPDWGATVAVGWKPLRDHRIKGLRSIWLVGRFEWIIITPGEGVSSYSVGLFSASFRYEWPLLKWGRIYGETGIGVMFPFDRAGQTAELTFNFSVGIDWPLGRTGALRRWDIHGEVRYNWLPDYQPTGGMLAILVGIAYEF